MKTRRILFIVLIFMPLVAFSQTDNNRWAIQDDGSISWNPRIGDPHSDHIEMSGERVSFWVNYKVDSVLGSDFERVVMFPGFRMKPNDTHATMMVAISDNDLPRVFHGSMPLKRSLINGYYRNGLAEKTKSLTYNGLLEVISDLERVERSGTTGKLQMKRTFYPSPDKPVALERLVFINTDDRPCTVTMEYLMRESIMDTLYTTEGPHTFVVYSVNHGTKKLQPGESVVFGIVYQALKKGESLRPVNPEIEMAGRIDRIEAIKSSLTLETPDPVLNTMFEFAKIRAGESIFHTRNGYINSPGGFRYHAAIWANDQAEYTGPWYGYAGYPLGVEAALNAYRWFAGYMNPEYKPIPSSIIAEGIDYWNGAGDRGDQAMIAYGAGRFALASGSREVAEELWPLIEWCLEFSRRKVNSDGVVESDSDELEGRFPAGDANLCTSSLYYDALLSAAMLGKELDKPKKLTNEYLKQAAQLRKAIEKHFGANVEGFDTYRYYDGNEVLRAWICIPLTVGIDERKEGTVAALFSPRLWTQDGLATQAGDKTFWDRATLYGLRGVFSAGETEKAMDYLKRYSTRRLLGNHVPYAVEAWPEGDQKHLSGESALYGRVITEGLFGLRPAGLTSFYVDPRLPAEWDEMALKGVVAFGDEFDVQIKRSGKTTLVEIIREGKPVISRKWNGKSPVLIKL